MTDEALVMNLGLGARAYVDLDDYERFVFAERLRAYCLFPKDEMERNSYLVCKSAYRLEGFNAEGPHKAVPKELRRLRSANRSKYLSEERRFYRTYDGDSAVLWSYGLELYEQYEERFNLQAIRLASVFLTLLKLDQTQEVRSSLSLAKATQLLCSDKTKKKRSETDNEPKSNFRPLGPPTIRFNIGRNERDLMDLWRHYASALPYVIAYGFRGLLTLIEGNIKDSNIADEGDGLLDAENTFYANEGAVPFALAAELFLTTKCPHPHKKPFIAKSTLWQLQPKVLANIEASEFKGVEPLVGKFLEQALSYKVV
ncbi:hypothetical protein [Ferrovibrio sp.]|uniref:hypothetical protein n=1 Tax=Ferrovibrio sp. TaxID=1917215 RepID=UPI000CB8D957|nr:hypothetical protein [Ferrovibrio sp.]PJI42170.1 MAG: hypothetical protein CTR53_06950 [Ferrovibrio sp.]